jgi:aconitate hydratase
MSPPLVVAYALAGTMNVEMTKEPLGFDRNGDPVFLGDVWPSEAEVREAVGKTIGPRLFLEEYANVYSGNDTWNGVPVTRDRRYRWSGSSTYIRNPPFFEGIDTRDAGTRDTRDAGTRDTRDAGTRDTRDAGTRDTREGGGRRGTARTKGSSGAIEGARVLAVFGDSITTDHISPAGSIPASSPAGKWLLAHGVEKKDFNSYGSRRGNHEVMMRGTFANIRIKNALVPGTEGGVTRLLPAAGAHDEALPIYDASMEYAKRGVPLIVIAGKEYGAGSSRDWAAKGTALLGVRAVIAESFERIHRSNLIGMGVLPLQFMEGESAASIGITGAEAFDIEPLEAPGRTLPVKARADGGEVKDFTVRARIDSAVELEYYRNGGILNTVLMQLAEANG